MLVLSATSEESAENSTEHYIKFYQYDNGLGAAGYDVVAYFEESDALLGVPAYQENFGGMMWRFASAENRDKFLADAAKYLPRYGGYCAYGAALGSLAYGDPEVWSIRDGVLYFNYNEPTRRAWLANDEEFIRESEKNWPALSQRE